MRGVVTSLVQIKSESSLITSFDGKKSFLPNKSNISSCSGLDPIPDKYLIGLTSEATVATGPINVFIYNLKV